MVLSPKVWEQVVVAISTGSGEFLQYEDGGDALQKGQILS